MPRFRKGTAPLVTDGNTPFHLVAMLYWISSGVRDFAKVLFASSCALASARIA